MKTYARVIDGEVAQIISPLFGSGGEEVPLNLRFGAEMLEQIVVYAPRPEPDPEPEPTIPELILRAQAEIRIQRQPIIEILDGLQASALTLGETERAQLIEVAKQGLRNLTSIDLTDCTTYEAMRLKVKARYAELAMALPSDIRKSFSEAIH